MPLFCWGDDFEPKLDNDGFLIDKRSGDKIVSKRVVRRTYLVNPKTFFLLTV